MFPRIIPSLCIEIRSIYSLAYCDNSGSIDCTVLTRYFFAVFRDTPADALMALYGVVALSVQFAFRQILGDVQRGQLLTTRSTACCTLHKCHFRKISKRTGYF